MSIVEYHRCDMCGEIIMDESKMGYFQGATWSDGESEFELCAKCSEKVQRFIRKIRGEGDDSE